MQYTIFINFDKLKFIHGYEAWENWEKKSSWGSEMNNTLAPAPAPHPSSSLTTKYEF